jgi:antitoxin component YwqK of YwqJK toxin-antitoxin module
MKTLISVLTIFILMLFTSGCESNEAIDLNMLQQRKDGMYLPNTETPYTGKFVDKYKNGQKKTEGSLKDGLPDGMSTTWYENGQKQIEGSLKNLKPDGMSTLWYENGQKQAEANFKDGQPDGMSTLWYENGQKQAEENHKDGKIDGMSIMWNENGEVTYRVSMKNGELAPGPAGGKIVYLDATLQHGLEVAPKDLANATWCTNESNVVAIETAVGSGAKNTAAIVAGCSFGIKDNAAGIADAYILNGFDNWFLPSLDELNILYILKSEIGGFDNNGYWSSTDHDLAYAKSIFFNNGIEFNQQKIAKISVRAIRAF